MEVWVAKLDRMDCFIASRPELGTPELRLVPQERWLSVVTASPMESEADIRQALARLRSAGESATAWPIRSALVDYLKAHDDRLPTDATQLDPFLPPDFDRSILARYEMLVSGKAGELPRTISRIMAATIVPDPEYGSAIWIGTIGYGSMAFSPQAIEQAKAQFAAANAGQQATQPGQIVPYLELPLPPVYGRKSLRAVAGGPLR
jgi:hypothetical protein